MFNLTQDLLKYQCPSCGAPLRFDPAKQMIICDSCDSEYPEDFFDIEEINEQSSININPDEKPRIDWKTEGFASKHNTIDNQKGYTCTSCGAEILSDGNTVATECLYCGNPVVISENIGSVLQPDFVIPFKIDKKQAEQILQNFYKGKVFLPNSFKDQNRISKISGLYVPYWLFSCSGEGSMNFKATKVRRWSTANYNYTNTKTYSIDRAGSLEFNHVPVDASIKMEDRYMEGLEPFRYEDLTEFSPMYMAGYFADKFDVNVDDSALRANERVIESTKDTFKNTISGYTTVVENGCNLSIGDTDIRYALFPVWMLNTKYEGKIYQFAINGQTGKVAGELPCDKKKMIAWAVGIAAAASAVLIPMFNLFLS